MDRNKYDVDFDTLSKVISFLKSIIAGDFVIRLYGLAMLLLPYTLIL